MKLWKMAVLALLPVGLACGSSSDSTGPSASAYVGSYTLTKINGTSLPTTVTQSGTTLTVTAGSANIAANNTWSASFTSTPVPFSTSGTYAVSGGHLVLTATDTSTSTATLSNNVLTVTSSGSGNTQLQFTFTKNLSN